jgi:hypothetical protein
VLALCGQIAIGRPAGVSLAMRAVLMVVAHVLSHKSSQVSLIEDDHVIEQISSATSHPALRHSVLPRAAKRGADRLIPISPRLIRRRFFARQFGLTRDHRLTKSHVESSMLWNAISLLLVWGRF